MGQAAYSPRAPRTGATRATNFSANPLYWLRRLLQQSPEFDDECRSHALLWFHSIAKMAGRDPRQLAVLKNAGVAYAHLVRLEKKLLYAEPTSDNATDTLTQWARTNEQFTKTLRMAGLATRDGLKGRGRKTGGIFTAPRAHMPSEVRAETAVPQEADGDE